jgi:GT2 family glycosyltransferase
MFLFEGPEKYTLRGVSYGPFQPNRAAELLPEPGSFRRDLQLIRAVGANTIRTYHVPPPWFCEAAEEFGVRLLTGIPWAQHIRFLDSRQSRTEIRRRVRQAALELRDAPNSLALLIGNEISPQVLRWYGPSRVEAFLGDLADEVRQVDPTALVSYASFPSTEYLSLWFADFVCFNVYLHRERDLQRYLARLQNLADFRPLVLSEFGVDSRREGEEAQAEIVARTAEVALEVGCAGTIVFSFTDEWFTGGFEIEDWDFGLVRRDRSPKPAYRRIQNVYESPAPAPQDSATSVSVVICAYNADRTLEECLESLKHLRYPSFEVIVVNDGSTDGTQAIAERFPEFRLINQENRGLSAARNVGIHEARGEVVAFTDADCAVDPDWLSFLVRRLCSEDFAGVGGPNLPPTEDGWVSDVVAHSPGGPTHVLLTDINAEHVPGCNMAFWRNHLLDVGAFDEVFCAAGDDVDICWRLQNQGYRIGYSPAALVWHRRRNTVRAYLEQQIGYGRAESQLRFKHPHRFNGVGQSRWAGRIYGGTLSCLLGRGAAIYAGQFGSALFQTLYEPTGSPWRYLPATFEWNTVAASLLAVGAAAAAVGMPMPTLILAGLALLGISVAQAIVVALRLDVDELPAWKARPLIALLCYLGPLVRAVERHTHRYQGYSRVKRFGSPRSSERGDIDRFWRGVSLAYWNETGLRKEECIDVIWKFLQSLGYGVQVDNGWQSWDLSIRETWVRANIRVLIENHGGKKCQVDIGTSLSETTSGKLLRGLYVGAILLGAASGSAGVFAVGLGVGAALEGLLLTRVKSLGRTVRDAIAVAAESLPVIPLPRSREEATSSFGAIRESDPTHG